MKLIVEETATSRVKELSDHERPFAELFGAGV
jgi:hypothetical protein